MMTNFKPKICVVTGTRAEYGLMRHLIKAIDDDSQLELQLVATGMHLTQEFGYTIDEIKKDNINIDYEVDMLVSSDSDFGTSKSIGLGIIGFTDALKNLKPDLLLVLGDRFESYAATITAMILGIKIGHIHGGEATHGLIDESIRHSITKMSHIHFASTQEYKKRIIQLGESSMMVKHVGSLGIDNISKFQAMDKKDFENFAGLGLNERNIFVTYHPVTLEKGKSSKVFGDLLRALDQLENTHLFFSMANADSEGRAINKMIEEYVMMNKQKSMYKISFGQENYFSCLKYMDFIVGNSSSGIIEAPSFGIGTLNIGNRQLGRIQAKSIINSNESYKGIMKGLNILISEPFSRKLRNIKNPYFKKDTLQQILNYLKLFDYSKSNIKNFNDL